MTRSATLENPGTMRRGNSTNGFQLTEVAGSAAQIPESAPAVFDTLPDTVIAPDTQSLAMGVVMVDDGEGYVLENRVRFAVRVRSLLEIVARYYLTLPQHTHSMTLGEEVGNILEAITMIESKIQSDGPDSGVNTAMQLRFEVVCEHWANVKQFCERLIPNYKPNAEEDSDDDEVAGSAASPPGDGPPGDGPPGDGPPKKKSAVQPSKRVRC